MAVNDDEINGKIRAAIEGVLPQMGELVAKRIVQMARTGKTMKDGEPQPLKPLSKEYINFRKHVADNAQDVGSLKDGHAKMIDRPDRGKGAFTAFLESKNVHSKAITPDENFFSPTRSNLTLEGTYLDNIKVTSIDKANLIVHIGPTGDNRGVSNLTLAGYLAKQGRSIFGLDQLGRSQCIQLIKQAIRKAFLKSRK